MTLPWRVQVLRWGPRRVGEERVGGSQVQIFLSFFLSFFLSLFFKRNDHFIVIFFCWCVVRDGLN